MNLSYTGLPSGLNKHLEEEALESFWNKITPEQDEKLQQYFHDNWGGPGAICKDNCESLFESWSEDLDLEEINRIIN